MLFDAAFSLCAAAAGGVAAISGFGIGSLLTPLLGVRTGIKIAVAAVSIPHFAATAARCWMLREHVDRRILLQFGVASGAGGLAGAFLHSRLRSPALGAVLGALLVFAGAGGLTGFTRRMRIEGVWRWLAGALSGGFGGLVGNQGGIRSAVMLGFDVPKESFVGTATAIGLVVDLCRMPFYLADSGARLLPLWPVIAAGTAAALIGTFAGRRALSLLPQELFGRVVSGVILALGVALLAGLGKN